MNGERTEIRLSQDEMGKFVPAKSSSERREEKGRVEYAITFSFGHRLLLKMNMLSCCADFSRLINLFLCCYRLN